MEEPPESTGGTPEAKPPGSLGPRQPSHGIGPATVPHYPPPPAATGAPDPDDDERTALLSGGGGAPPHRRRPPDERPVVAVRRSASLGGTSVSSGGLGFKKPPLPPASTRAGARPPGKKQQKKALFPPQPITDAPQETVEGAVEGDTKRKTVREGRAGAPSETGPPKNVSLSSSSERSSLDDAQSSSSSELYAAFGLFVLTSLGNRLFQKLQTYPMYNYPLAVNLLSTAVYVPVCFAYIIPAIHCVTPSPITEEQRNIPKVNFAIMGALDCVSSLMQVLSVNFIPNASTLVLLQQAAIPISMVISRLSFKHVKYDAWQISGAAVVLCGIVVVLLPQIKSSSSSQQVRHPTTTDDDRSDDSVDDDDSSMYDPSGSSSGPLPQWVWSCVIILSCVPMCYSSVFKEKALGDHDVDVVYLNGWIAVFQTFMSLPMAIPTAFATGLPLLQIPKNILDGFKCYAGHNSVFAPSSSSYQPLARGGGGLVDDAAVFAADDDDDDDDVLFGGHLSAHLRRLNASEGGGLAGSVVATGTALAFARGQSGSASNALTTTLTTKAPPPESHLKVDACGAAPYFVTAFLLFNLAYNVMIILILKRGSSSLLYLGSTVLVPVSNCMFALRFIPGHKPLHWADVLGLFVIMAGLALYRAGAPEQSL